MRDPRFTDHWTLTASPYGKNEQFRFGSLMMSGNGYLGFRGGFPDFRRTEYAACVVSDTYDCADGKWKELCTVPNGLFARVYLGEESISIHHSVPSLAGHGLDFHYGETFGSATSADGGLRLNFRRFADYADLHRVWQRLELTSRTDTEILLSIGIDADVWSLNGSHFRTLKLSEIPSGFCADIETAETGLPIRVITGSRILASGNENDRTTDSRVRCRNYRLSLSRGIPLLVDQCMVVYSGNDTPDPQKKAVEELETALTAGFEAEQKKHRAVWEAQWSKYDIRIEGDEELEPLLRYNTYHNIIAAPAHADRLPIGARGLSCQAYQGAAFWDQEIFNLPMYIYTDPTVAANILSYRYSTLTGALDKAKRLGYDGAFYPWISGDSGEELCPDYFFVDVLTGRKIRNHFNDWQIHVSPDISYAVWEYLRASDDKSFLYEKGAEILFQVARFIYSRVHYSPARDRYEIIRVLGPDEYHENVDNNAFTNYQSRFALQKAAETYRRMGTDDPNALRMLTERLKIDEETVAMWETMAEKLYLPQPDPASLLIEQFDGYFGHEDILPEPLGERLKDANEYWGWPNGIAFETQVIKQADVVQLFALHAFDEAVVRANYAYYEPRTQHRSSLSPGVHALVAAKAGNIEQAEHYFRRSLTIDIDNTHPPESGGTFIGGIHTAACGIAWQIVVKGFLGMELCDKEICFRPRIPGDWKRLKLCLTLRGQRIELNLDSESLTLVSSGEEGDTLQIRIGNSRKTLSPGGSIRFALTTTDRQEYAR